MFHELRSRSHPTTPFDAGMYMLGQGTAKNEAMARHILKTVAKCVCMHACLRVCD